MREFLVIFIFESSDLEFVCPLIIRKFRIIPEYIFEGTHVSDPFGRKEGEKCNMFNNKEICLVTSNRITQEMSSRHHILNYILKRKRT